MNKETKLAIAAVILLLVAGGIFALNFSRSSNTKVANPPTKAELDKQISDIQNNPHMPEQAKAISIGQIKSRSAGFGAPLKQGDAPKSP